MFKLIVINRSQNSGQQYTKGEIFVTVLSEKNTVINYTHWIISSSQFNIKAFIWQYTYTTMNVSYLKLTSNYGENKKIWDIKATNWRKKVKKLTFPAVFMTDLISLLHAFRDFIWIYALTLYCQRKNTSM